MRSKSRGRGAPASVLVALVLGLGGLGVTMANATAVRSQDGGQSGSTETDSQSGQAQSGQSGDSAEITDLVETPELLSTRVACPFSGTSSSTQPSDSDALLGASTVEGGGEFDSYTPIPHFNTIRGGTGAVFAQTSDGNVWTWGYDFATMTGQSAPTIIYSSTEFGGEPITFHQIAAQSKSVLALDQHCRLWAWGENNQGQLGLGATPGYVGSRADVARPVLVLDSTGAPYYFQKIVTTPVFPNQPAYSMGLDFDGHVKVWGGSKNWNSDMPWEQTASMATFSDIALTFDSQKGGVWGYGIYAPATPAFRHGMPVYWNVQNDGNLNYITKDNFDEQWRNYIPDRCDEQNLTFTRLATEYQGVDEEHTPEPRMLAVTNCGTLWEIGQHTVDSSPIGTRAVYNNLYLTEISSNLNSVVLLSSDTSLSPVWTWGTNQTGQLGIGQDTSYVALDPTPVMDLAGKQIIDVATGGEFVLALTITGELWGWGDNTYSQLSLPIEKIYPSPELIAIKPTLTLYVEDKDGSKTPIPPSSILWELNESGLTTGNITASVPSHKSGYYPIYQINGSALNAGGSGPTVPAFKVGEYGFLFPLTSLTADYLGADSFKTGSANGGIVDLIGSLASAQKALAANATVRYQTQSPMAQSSVGTWDGVSQSSTVNSDNPGTYKIAAWAEVDGRVVSYNPDATDALDTTNLAACVSSPKDDDDQVNPVCMVETDVKFIADGIFIQKRGENTNGDVEPMDGSQWAIFTDDNGGLGAEVFPGGVPAAQDANDVEITGTFFAKELAAGTYWLRETTALEGFNLLAEDVQFQIDGNGQVQILQGNSDLIDVDEDLFDNPTIVIQDVPKYEMPEAAGTPLGLFAVVGLMLGVTALVVARVTRSKPAGRHAS